jgi:hypothetical protein
MPQIWIPHQSVEVIRFLFAHGLKMRTQYSLMAMDAFKYNASSPANRYQYTPSAFY